MRSLKFHIVLILVFIVLSIPFSAEAQNPAQKGNLRLGLSLNLPMGGWSEFMDTGFGVELSMLKVISSKFEGCAGIALQSFDGDWDRDLSRIKLFVAPRFYPGVKENGKVFVKFGVDLNMDSTDWDDTTKIGHSAGLGYKFSDKIEGILDFQYVSGSDVISFTIAMIL